MSRNKIGFLVQNLSLSEQNFYLIDFCNRNKKIDTTVFYNTPSLPCIELQTACMHMTEAWSYDGVGVSTDLGTTKTLLNLPGIKDRYYYMWNMEWFHSKEKNFEQLARIYQNPELKLICRCKEHAEIVRNCWNTEPFVLEKYEKLLAHVGRLSTSSKNVC